MFQPNAMHMSGFNYPMMPFPFYQQNPKPSNSQGLFKVVKNFDIFHLPKHTIKAQIVMFNDQPHVSVSKFLDSPCNPNGMPTRKGIFMPAEAWHSLCDSMDSINIELSGIFNSASVACMKFK